MKDRISKPQQDDNGSGELGPSSLVTPAEEPKANPHCPVVSLQEQGEEEEAEHQNGGPLLWMNEEGPS